jgi:hypothetical protein
MVGACVGVNCSRRRGATDRERSMLLEDTSSMIIASTVALARRRYAAGSALTSDDALYAYATPVRASPADTMIIARVDTPRDDARVRRNACANGTVSTHGDGAPIPSVTVATDSTKYSRRNGPAADADMDVVGVCVTVEVCEPVGLDESDCVVVPVGLPDCVPVAVCVRV